jgi:hypothetical protein
MTESARSPSDASASDRDEFFVGWRPTPRKYVRFLRPIVAALLLAAGATAVTLAVLQRDPGTGQWDVDNVRTFDGIAYTKPYAMVRIPGERPEDPPRTLLLVEDGKFGALARVARLVQGRTEGVAVRVTGTILHRDGRFMLELAEGDKGLRRLTAAEQAKLPPLGWPAPEVLAEHVTLKGEIIDPKCYLGAMKPGGGKTHKACAMLCISGGVPPMLVTRDAAKNETFYLLATAEGGVANERVLDFVGDPVEVSGRLERHGDLHLLRIAVEGVRRRGRHC